jgi:hypothetical protein
MKKSSAAKTSSKKGAASSRPFPGAAPSFTQKTAKKAAKKK